MNTLKNIAKKAVSVGSGMLLLGGTLGGALAAADLGNYPAPFIQNGQFNGLIVVGENAMTSDVLGSIEIASSLQAASTSAVSGGGTSVGLTGDVHKIGDSADMLEIGEALGGVTETITDNELQFLRSGVVTTNSGDTDFTQVIELDGVTANVNMFENNDDETGVFLFFDDGSTLFTYELEFTSGLESDVESDVLVDLEDENIVLLGQNFNIVQAERVGANSIRLELMAGDITDTMEEGQTKTYTVDGQSYEVTVLFVTDTGEAKFLVNGQASNSLEGGETEKIAGIEIGVREVLSQSRGATGGTLVEFYLGANKIEIEDTDTTAVGGGRVEINGENIEDATVDVSGTIGATTAVITSITYTLDADVVGSGDVYLMPGEGVREYLDEPEGMIADEWDIVYQGISAPGMTDIEFTSIGDDEYELTFTNRRGDEFTVPLLEITGATDARWGTAADEALWFYEIDSDNSTMQVPAVAADFLIQLDDFFVITDTDGTAVDNGDDTYVLQWVDVEATESTLIFEHVATGQEIRARWDTLTATSLNGDITIGGKDFDFWYNSTHGLAVDLDNDGAYGAVDDDVPVQAPIVVRGGGILRLATTDADMDDDGQIDSANVIMSLETQADDLDEGAALTTTWTFTAAASELDIGTLAGDVTAVAVKNQDRDLGINRYGTMFDITDETGEANDLRISYPNEQVEALVYVTGGNVQTSTTNTGGAVRVNPLGVGFSVLDSEVTDAQFNGRNMIVVGGPCVNTVAARLMGNPAVCTEGFEDGKATLKLFDNNSRVALLVAGYSAQDTQRASRVIAQSGNYDLMGMEAELTTSSASNIQVTNR